MAKYRRKAVDVDALQWSGSNWHSMLEFLDWDRGIKVHTDDDQLVFDDDRRALPKDWVVVLSDGRFSIVGDIYFNDEYEEVKSD